MMSSVDSQAEFGELQNSCDWRRLRAHVLELEYGTAVVTVRWAPRRCSALGQMGRCRTRARHGNLTLPKPRVAGPSLTSVQWASGVAAKDTEDRCCAIVCSGACRTDGRRTSKAPADSGSRPDTPFKDFSWHLENGSSKGQGIGSASVMAAFRLSVPTRK